MSKNKLATPLVQEGQVYLNANLNDYLVVVKASAGHVYYAGKNFKGQQEVEDFVARFKPVDPDLLDAEEIAALQIYTPVTLKMGWVE